MSDFEIVDQAARDTVETDLGRTLFVEAGAGTGKTTALVKRIVRLVLTSGPERQSLAQIAAITFTEAAAAELRERTREAFEERLHLARRSGDDDLAQRCEAALAEADVAAISTLHSFAQRLLSDFPVEVGIPPRVEVVDEVRSQLAFDKRWSEFLDELYEDPDVEEFIVRAAILGVDLNKSAVRNIAQAFDDNWDFLLGIEVTDRAPMAIDTSTIREWVFQIRKVVSDCSDPGDKFLACIQNAEPTFARFDRATDDRERLRIVKLMTELKFGLGVGRGANWADLPAVKDLCASLKEHCEAVIEAVTNESLRRLAERIAIFTYQSAQQRRADGVLEFHDLLVLAHELLRTSPEARLALSERYKVLMLDEFQDTDPLQISLATLLATSIEGVVDTDWSDLPTEDGRLFFVGDPKQSIYRFRRADITLFLKAAKQFASGAVTLQQNFRTVSPIIEMVNGFFDMLMPEETEGQAKYTPLVPFREPTAADHRPLIFGGPIQGNAADAREAEAAAVAAIVAETLEHPDRWQVLDKSGEWRAPKLSDITILLPTRTSLSQLSHALDDRGIPFRADTGTLVYETQEIRDLLSVLRAIDDASDQISLVAALRSPLYACGYDDLYCFVDGGGSLELHGYIPPELSDSVVAQGLEHLQKLSAQRWWEEPSALLQRVVDERNAMALPAAGRRPRDTWRRIRYVIDQARAFSEAGGGDLRNYLDWTRLQGADGSRAHEPMLPEPDDEAVQIMTIHGSKGLEFPITIVSGLTTARGGRRNVGEVKWGERGVLPEVSISKAARTRFFDLAKELDDEMDGPERDRLLYVGLTRARDHLAVSGCHVMKKDKPTPSFGLTINEWAEADGSELVRRFEFDPDEAATAVATFSTDDGDEGEVVLPSRSSWAATHHDRLARGSQRSTISATAMAKSIRDTPLANDESDLETGRDPLAEEPGTDALPPREFRRGRTGTAIGTAVHAVLQLLDLKNPTPQAIAELSSAQAWSESVPEHTDAIQRAVESALGSPIVRSCAGAAHWKELYVATPVGAVTLEGYVDLVVDTPEGLVVVDYKTDSVPNDRAVDAKVAQYRLQGAAYAVAIETATGRPVVDVQFVFCGSGTAVVRHVSDLDAAKAEVRDYGEHPMAQAAVD